MKEPWTGKIYRLLSHMSDYMMLSLLFYLFSLPIFTIGASVSALHETRKEMEEVVFGSLSKSFLNNFKKNFSKSTVLFLIFTLVTSILIMFILFTNIRHNQVLLMVMFFLLTIIFLNYSIIFLLIGNNSNRSYLEILQLSFDTVNTKSISVVTAFIIAISLVAIPLFKPKLFVILVLFLPALLSKIKYSLIIKE